MNNSPAFLPGHLPSHPGPLSRFLPPLPSGVGRTWLQDRIPPGSLVIDPFGASPRLLREIALAGYRILVAANNPISRFLIELFCAPPSEDQLRSALADLAVDPKTGERVEQHIRTLYDTECANCGRRIEAQAFIWDRDSNSLVGKFYSCPTCKDTGERQISPSDIQRHAHLTGSGLHKSRALERVAALNDPDRRYAEEALAIYPPRAVYALFKLINRLDLLEENNRYLVSALLLAAFDQSNGMWHHPGVRFRPKQLSLPVRYLEKNVWLTLEEAVVQWPAALFSDFDDTSQVPLTFWPQLPDHNGICIFEGRLKDLAEQIKSNQSLSIRPAAFITAIPRPNQAFWTLSALWAGWLWGKAASAPFKSVLRRRRYDWNWHFVALGSAFTSLHTVLENGVPGFGFIGEAESGFISSAVLSAVVNGIHLNGAAIRINPEQAEISWEAGEIPGISLDIGSQNKKVAQDAISDFLRINGEPSTYLKVYAAGVSALAQSYRNVKKTEGNEGILAEFHRSAENAINGILNDEEIISRLNTTSRSLDTGQWWLKRPYFPESEIAPPLADRVEIEIVRLLQTNREFNLGEVDKQICREFKGLFTPDLELIQQILLSYAEVLLGDEERWLLRPQDIPTERRKDLEEIQQLLHLLGSKLGFHSVIDNTNISTADHPTIHWKLPEHSSCYHFYLTASGVLGNILLNNELLSNQQHDSCHHLIVLPGSRAGLVELKLRRDVRLRTAVEKKWDFLKFRHVRWLAENEGVDQSSFEFFLKKDPLANRDLQMPLL